jgi:hypothetical protein
MKTKVIITILALLSCGVYPVRADTVWTEGYHKINAGEVYGEVWIQNDVKLDIFGGNISQLGALNNTITNWYGGQMGYLLTRHNSIVNIFGGKLNFLVPYEENSQINLYAYNVTLNELTRIVEGNYYKDDSHFSFMLNNSKAYSHITVVPEPSTLFLLGIGCLFLRHIYR